MATQYDSLIIGDRSGQHIHIKADSVTFFDKCSTERIAISLEGDGAPILELKDGNGNGRIVISVQQDGAPYVTLRDGNFTQRLELLLDSDDGLPYLELFDGNEKQIFSLGPDHKGDVRLNKECLR
ncbi:MAG: hypothetical protein AB7P18_05590 [Candidatus Binatia bacterium]